MSLETRKILDMLAEGKISAADAEKLLNKVSGGAATDAQPGSAPGQEARPRPRFLRVTLDEPDRKQVNVRVPLALARAGLSMWSVLPANVADKLRERGIDLDQIRNGMGTPESAELFKQLDVDVDIGDGKKVHVFCE